MNTKTLKLATLLSALITMTLLVPSRAAADDDDDPPARVARLSFTSGAVSFSPAGTDDWVTPALNRPITTGDKLWTDRGARAELSLGSSYIRMSSETGFSFLNLDDQTTQIRVTEGTISLRVRRLDDNEIVEVDTPNLAFNVSRPGSYKIDVNENGDATVVVVHDGSGDVTGGGASYSLNSDQVGTFTGTDELNATMDSLRSDDDFDQWCADRDRRYERSASARYVSDDVIGYEDLDDYGGWRTVPDYGTVWFPHTTVVGWAPYRYGHWVWISPWGWTWVDDAPWGFAPFHYGRWVTVGGVWGWVPVAPRPRVVTAVYVRPVYAPALVAWVGGAHWGVGVAVGSAPTAGVAWFPLGPRDVYCPSYHVSQRYVERVNISNTTVINRTYVTNVYNNVYVNKTVNVTNVRYQNQGVNGAVTATSRTTFTSSQPVGRNIIRVNEREVVSAPVAPLTPTVRPEQRSVLGGGVQARVQPPQRVINRTVVARTAPPPAPVKFDRQQQAIEANGGRPISVNQERQLNPGNDNVRRNIRIVQPSRTVTPPQNQNQQGNNRPALNNDRNGRNDRGNRDDRPVNQPPAQIQNQPQQQQQPPVRNNERNDRPVTQPPQQQVQQPNANNNQQDRDRGRRGFGDRPPNSRPNQQQVNPAVEQRQEQQMEKLRQQQDNERQKLEQRQIQEQQKVQIQRANEQRQEQARQRQQQQLQQMEQRHDQQQQKLEQKQRQEVQKEQRREQSRPQQQKPPKNEDKQDKRPH